MNTFIYLLIGHFYADYPCQPSKLVAYKKAHFSGVLIHAYVHFLVTLIVFIPFLGSPRVWAGLFTVLITHSLIDKTKIAINKLHNEWTVPLYFIDQALHVAVSYGIALYIGVLDTSAIQSFAFFYQYNSIAVYVLLLPIVTYFYDVTYQIVKFGQGEPFKRNYRMMIQNALIVTVAFAIYWLS